MEAPDRLAPVSRAGPGIAVDPGRTGHQAASPRVHKHHNTAKGYARRRRRTANIRSAPGTGGAAPCLQRLGWPYQACASVIIKIELPDRLPEAMVLLAYWGWVAQAAKPVDGS